MNNFEAPVYEKGYPDFDAVNREETFTTKREADAYEEYARMLDDVSDERIEDLFNEMGIDIDLNKDWD